MKQLIDAEKLIAEIEKRQEELSDHNFHSMAEEYDNILDIIASLQQEQPEAQNGKFVFPKYLYARTKDNKTIDMSYASQDMTAVEYIRNDFVEQEQSEVDLEKEEFVGVAESPSKTFPRVNDFECGGSYRH